MNIHQVKQYIQNNLIYGEQKHGSFERFFGVQPLVAPDTSRPWGTDISHWDGNVQLGVTKAKGAEFTFVKAIDGTLTARYFVENRQRAKNAVLIDGAYGWLYRNVNVSCVAQAQAYDALMNKYPVTLPPVIDFEPTTWAGQASNPTYDDLRKWGTEWLRLGNPKGILYSAAYYMNSMGQIPSDVKDMFVGLWVAHYGTLNPTLPKGYAAGEWLFHQFTSSGDAKVYSPNDAGKLEVDMNYAISAARLAQLSGTVTDPEPVPAGEYQKVRRFESDCHLVIADPKRYRLLVTNTHNELERTSAAAKRYAAKWAINGDGWYGAVPYATSLACSDGNLYQPIQDEFNPFFNQTRSGAMQFGHVKTSDLFNTVSGSHYLVVAGTVNTALFGTSVTMTEKHPRTAVGVDAAGHVMLLVVEGRSESDSGVTLSQLANILIEFGAQDAIALDGGGSSTLCQDGVVMNYTSDGAERAVINHLVLIPEGATMAKNRVMITWDAGARERQYPRATNANDTSGAILADNTVHYSDFDVVPDMDDPNNVDKRWIKLQSGWYIATRYPSSSGIYERAKVEAIIAPPPVEPSILVSHIFDDTLVVNGKEYTAHFEVPNVEYKPKA